MHELSIARSLFELAVEEAARNGVRRVSAVTCRMGVLRQIVPSLLQTAFESVCDGTPLAGCSLRTELEPVQIACQACGRVSACSELAARCPACGSARIGFSGGMDLQLTSISVPDEGETDGHPRAPQSA